LQIDTVLAHNLIYGAIDFAEEAGFKPHEEFRLVEYILNPDLVDDGIDDIVFGKDDKHFYISGPFDNTSLILHTLQKNLGQGNYNYISHIE
jgi:hypothetical protein